VIISTSCLTKPIILGLQSLSANLKLKQDMASGIKIPTEVRTKKTESLIAANVFKTISDPMSMELFKSISEAGSNSSDLRSKTGLSRRQYYSRISNFTRNGMLAKKNKRNYRTTFGLLVYHMLMKIENALSDYYKLKAIDSIELYHAIPKEEHKKIIDTLITDPEIREVLLSRKSRESK
jgi:hypothetical protein